MEANGGFRRQHAISSSDKKRIVEPVAEAPQCVADRRLCQPQAIPGRREITQIPDRKKYAQEIKIERIILLVHDADYDYEFDLGQLIEEPSPHELCWLYSKASASREPQEQLGPSS